MPAPVITALSRIDVHALSASAGGTCEVQALEHFVVVAAGSFQGVEYERGDVLVCGGTPKHGDAIVLVARGHGRPRLGQVRGKQLLGDAGERCLEARWRAAGTVVSVARGVMAVEDVPRVAGPARPLPRTVARLAPCRVEQLSLFAGEAA